MGRKRGQIFAEAGMHESGAEGLRQNKATVFKNDATRPITVIRLREHLDFISIKSVSMGPVVNHLNLFNVNFLFLDQAME